VEHKFFKINRENKIIKKKIFFIIIRKIHGEIDWILPLVNKFNDKYLFFAIIENKKEITVLKRNLFLYNQFKKNFHGYFLENRYKNFFLRIYLKFLNLFDLTYKNKIVKKFNQQYYSYKKLLSIIEKNYNISKLKKVNILVSYDKINNNWEKEISKNKISTTFYFPSSCSVKPKFTLKLKKVNNQNRYKNKFLLLSNSINKFHWQNLYPKLKQLVIGYPRYANFWIKNIQVLEKKNSSIKIYLSYRRELYNEDWFKKAIAQVNQIKLILKKINKEFKIYVKLHPYTNQNELTNYLTDEKNLKFMLTDLHQQEICRISDFSINFFNSASIMESLSMKKPAIELSQLSSESNTSPYKDYNISFYAKNEIQLERYIKKLVFNDNKLEQEFKKKYTIFKKVFLKNNPIKTFEKFLNLKRNTINNKPRNRIR